MSMSAYKDCRTATPTYGYGYKYGHIVHYPLGDGETYPGK